jgi:malonyl-CoA O-methyltransferase
MLGSGAGGYEACADGKLPATFEVFTAMPGKTAPKQTPDGRAIVRFDLPRKG